MDFSQITDDIFIGTTPSVSDYEILRELGIKLVINMRWEYRPRPDPHNPALNFLWLPTFDSPFLPIPIKYLIRGAHAALETISGAGKVYVHCAGGRHRGVAMGAAILIALGEDPESAMDLIQSRRAFADPRTFYIRSRILKFSKEWNGNLKK